MKKSRPPKNLGVSASSRDPQNPEGKSTLVPKLRFPAFRDAEGWEEKSAGELFTNRNERGKDGLPIYSVTMDDGMVMRSSLDRKFDDIAESEGNKKVHKNDIAYNMMRMWQGAFGVAVEDCMVSPAYVVLAPQEGVSSDFFGRLMKTPCLLRSLTSQSHGLTKDRLRLYYKDFAQIALPLPSPAEQQKIAECLSSVDELMAAQGRKVDALKTHKKGLMQQLFPREGETQPRLRFPEFQNAGEWEVKTLGGVCKLKAGEFVSASAIAEAFKDGLFPCYGGNGLRGYVQSFTHEGTYVLIGRQGALCGNVNLFHGKFHATEHALVVSPHEGVATNWLYYALHWLNLNRFAIGQAQPGLSVGVLNNVALAMPCEEDEQQHIADCLTTLDALITAETQKLEALKTHKKGLMQQLFPSEKLEGGSEKE